MPKSKNRRIVVKVGTGLLTRGVGELDVRKMGNLCRQMARAASSGVEVVLVSSGAVGLGMGRLGLTERPKNVRQVQKCAAVGQGILIRTWEELFAPESVTVAQILLTRDDVDIPARHKALRELLDELLGSGIIPVINENDCVSAAELNIKFGDNDVLSSLVAALSKADDLVILSTAPGLVDIKGTGELVSVVEKIGPRIRAMAEGTSSRTAVGGMVTKIKAAEIATASGCNVHIADGSLPDVVGAVLRGENPGTFFKARSRGASSKKRWLAHFGRTIAKVYADAGAVRAVREKGASLLSAGVVRVSGKFSRGDMVEIADASDGNVVARGLAETDFDSARTKPGGKNPRARGVVVVHRDNLALV